MPSHGLVPYKLKIRESGDKSNYWNLRNLTPKDPSLPHNDFIDTISEFCDHFSSNPDEDEDLEKTFRIEEYIVEDNIVEGIIRTGDYGYSSILRDIETNREQKKEETVAEELPFYFTLYFPQTSEGKNFNNGKEALLVLQGINRRGVKTVLLNHLRQEITSGAENSVLEINPVMTSEVLDKVINSTRIPSIEFVLRSHPDDEEEKYRLMEGIDEEKVRKESLVLKPEYGGSWDKVKKYARKFKDTNQAFGEIVSDNISDLKAEIEKPNGRTEIISLLDDEIKMNKNLNPQFSDLYEGLPKTEYIGGEARKYVNDIYDTPLVEPIKRDTRLPNIRAEDSDDEIIGTTTD